ncbi:hypothetical protein, partial [Bradyrhizobium sp.]|uniref:hypothetical protein n=1 Tax=Bradyrhizobium sp. TaxID=376 RepID=UPI00290DEAE5
EPDHQAGGKGADDDERARDITRHAEFLHSLSEAGPKAGSHDLEEHSRPILPPQTDRPRQENEPRNASQHRRQAAAGRCGHASLRC